MRGNKGYVKPLRRDALVTIATLDFLEDASRIGGTGRILCCESHQLALLLSRAQSCRGGRWQKINQAWQRG